MTPDDVRRVALDLDGASERDHHGFPSFRHRTIFATLPEPQTLRLMLPEGEILAGAAEHAWAREGYWGKRLASLEVHLPDADPAVVTELLQEAWAAHA